jgi:hypothetical protein
MLMIVNFALTLPGRAPATLVAVASWLAMPIAQVVALHSFNPGIIIALAPAFIAASGGRLFGSFLDTAAAQLEPTTSDDGPWYRRPLSTRFLLAVSLTIIAAIGVPVLAAAVRPLELRAANWQVMVWTIMSLLGWILLALMMLRERPVLRRLDDSATPGIRPIDFAAHLSIIIAVAAIHTLLVLGASAALLIPVLDRWAELAPALFKAFLSLDMLAYLAILALGFASDAERHRRAAAQRAAALEAESLENRLSALRARLNPHFLFNALNSVTVLARSGKSSEAADVVDGVTSLLRYVLDDRRASVPLREELDFARRYFDVQRVRFGARLKSTVASSAAADDALVPQLLLQPIIENAVEHGVAKTLEGGAVAVEATTSEGALRVSITDDGPGPVAASDREQGIGLASTSERLSRLYGPRATLRLERASSAGGTRVDIVIPLEA